MQTEHRANKNAIRVFMQNHYTDERLAQLLAHAQEGKLVYHSCCCFIGVATAGHPLRTDLSDYPIDSAIMHLESSRQLAGSRAAEFAFDSLGSFTPTDYAADRDALRRRILIPMIRAEMRRRDRLSALKPLAAAIVREHVEANCVE